MKITIQNYANIEFDREEVFMVFETKYSRTFNLKGSKVLW